MTKLAEIVRELTEKAENEVKTIIQSEEELAEYLTFCSKFYHYSSRNQLLIYHQRPGAIACLGFSEMKKRGLNLRKGSKAIQILAPMIVKEEDMIEIMRIQDSNDPYVSTILQSIYDDTNNL